MVSHYPFMFGFARGRLSRLGAELRWLPVPKDASSIYAKAFEDARRLCAEMADAALAEIDAREEIERKS